MNDTAEQGVSEREIEKRKERTGPDAPLFSVSILIAERSSSSADEELIDFEDFDELLAEFCISRFSSTSTWMMCSGMIELSRACSCFLCSMYLILASSISVMSFISRKISTEPSAGSLNLLTET